MTTYTTYQVRPTVSTLTLTHEHRTITITAQEDVGVHDLFEMFHAALIGVGFVSETYHDIIAELALARDVTRRAEKRRAKS